MASENDKSMAQRRRDLVYLDRSKTLDLLQSHEWGRAQLAATEHRLRPGMSRLETADWAMDKQWQISLDAAATVRMPGIVRDMRGLEVVFLPREEVSASCESFADGSGLVTISDAMSSLVWRLATFNSAWRGGRSLLGRMGRRRKVREALSDPDRAMEAPGLQAATAALRYSAQHVRVWGTSAVIGLRKEQAGLRDGVLAATFVHAHEIGHFVLGHDLPSAKEKSPAEREFEADEFAMKALLGTFGSFDLVTVGSAAIIALCAIQVWETAALLRDVRVHPPLLERWQALAGLLGASSVESEGHTFAARVISSITASSGSIPTDFWDVLRADRDYEIVHGLPYLLMVQGFDMTESMTLERRHELIDTLASKSPAFVDGWRVFSSDGWAAGYEAWGINPAGLFDASRSLSYWQVVNRIAAAPVWGDTSDAFRRTCALLAIHARSDELRTVS